MADETSSGKAAANLQDAKVVDAAAAMPEPVRAAPVSEAANLARRIEQHYHNVRPFGRLGLKLFLAMVGVAALFTLAAGVRQKYFKWPPYPKLAVIPKRNLPAYHQIQASELRTQVRLADKMAEETSLEAEDVIGRYTLEALPEGKPVAEVQLAPAVDSVQFLGKAVVEVPVTAATVLNGKLKAGDVVDVIFQSPPTQGQQQSQPLSTSSFENIFVLNVKPIEKPVPAPPGQAENNYLLIIAVPLERHSEFMLEIAKKTTLTVQTKELTT